MGTDGAGGLGDAPLAIGPAGGGGIKPKGIGIASGGGDVNGLGGSGGMGLGRMGAAGGTALASGGGPGGTGFGGFGGDINAGRGARPSGGNGQAVTLSPGLSSRETEESGGALKSKTAAVIPGPPHRGIGTTNTGGLIRVGIGLAKHSADWDSSPHALLNLRAAFIERSGLPELEVTVPTVDLSDLSAMMKCRTIMITSNFPIAFKPAEIAGMRDYIAA